MDIVNEHDPNWFVKNGKSIRRILDSDLNYQRILSSEVLSVSIGAGERDSASNGAVRVRKTVHAAKIFQCQGTFTTTTLEAVGANDRDKVRMVSYHARTKQTRILMTSFR